MLFFLLLLWLLKSNVVSVAMFVVEKNNVDVGIVVVCFCDVGVVEKVMFLLLFFVAVVIVVEKKPLLLLLLRSRFYRNLFAGSVVFEHKLGEGKNSISHFNGERKN